MTIEIIPKQKSKKTYWVLAALIICVVLILGFGATYLYFTIAANKISKNIANLEESIRIKPDEKILQDGLIIIEDKINIFGNLLSNHDKTANILAFIEQRCHPGVWITSFSFNEAKMEVKIAGRAQSFVALEQQLTIFKQEKQLKKINLSEVSMSDKGDVSFGFLLTVDPQILKQ